MGFAEARAQLEARQPEHMPGPSLDRIREVVNYLDHPELTYPTIHVTGTNGKTTAARVTGAVGCAYGLTAGVFTSPHLLSVTERFSICGVDMTEREFADEWAHLEPFLELVDGLGLGEVTYFEAVTALAYLWFADRPVGLGVFEVGMGGSWDATNLVTGDVAVITPVGLDHVAELGPTLADIAAEKAGILKPGRTGVIRAQDPEVAVVLARRADEVGATLLHEGADWEVEEELLAVGGQSFRVRGSTPRTRTSTSPCSAPIPWRTPPPVSSPSRCCSGQALDEATVRKGLREVRSPGRLEVVGREPLVLLDGAHNPAGAGALAEALERAFTVGSPPPRARREREQGRGGDRGSARAAGGRRLRHPQRQRAERGTERPRRGGEGARAPRGGPPVGGGGARRRSRGREPLRRRPRHRIAVHGRRRETRARDDGDPSVDFRAETSERRPERGEERAPWRSNPPC